MIAIWKREFRSYFQTVTGWLYIGATLALYGLYFFAYNLSYGYSKVSYSLSAITFLFLITVPILTMRSLSEEQKSKTDQLIFTAPVSIGKIVTAKYLAMAAIHTITVLVISLTPLILLAFGKTPVAENYVAILGFWLYGLCCISVGVFVSSLTESQVISAVLTFAFLFVGYMMSSITGLISQTGNLITKILSCYDIISPMDNFTTGTLSVTGIVYYVTVTCLFLFLAAQSIQKRRWSISSKKIKTGVFSVGFIVTAVVLTVIINLFAKEIPSTITAIDVTSQKLYSLTKDTKEYLKSLEKDVTIYAIASEKSMDDTVSETLKRYADSNSHIKVEYKDPYVNPNFYQSYTDSAIEAGSLIVSCGEVSRVINYSDLFESTVDYSTYSQQTTGFDGEGQITSALQYVTNENMPVIYEIKGHGEAALAGRFTEAVQKANVTLNTINLLEYDTVPEDAQAVIINGPVSDFSADDAKKMIDYLAGGGNALITANYEADANMENFQSVLKEYGIAIVKGMIAEGDSNRYYQNPFYLLPEVSSSSYTASVGSDYVFVPYAQGITYPEDSDEITYTKLLSTSERAVSKADVANAASYEYEEGDEKGPFTVGVAAAKAIEEDKSSQVVVFGSQMMFTDDADNMVSGKNSGLFSDTVSGFVNTEGMSSIVIPVKEYDAGKLTVAMSQQILIGLSLAILLPVLLLVSGIVIWVKRRKR